MDRQRNRLEALAAHVGTLSSLEEAAEQLLSDPGTIPEEELAAQDPRAQPEYTFNITHTDSRGRIFAGEFVNQFMSRADQRKIAEIEVQLNGRRPIGVTPPAQAVQNHILAWMHISLIHRPPWAADLDSIASNNLLERLFAEVWSHQEYFSGDADIGLGGASKA